MSDFSEYQREENVEAVFGIPNFEIWNLYVDSGLIKAHAVDVYHLISAVASETLDQARDRLNSFTLAMYQIDGTQYTAQAFSPKTKSVQNKRHYAEPYYFAYLYSDPITWPAKRSPEQILNGLRTPWAARVAKEKSVDLEEVVQRVHNARKMSVEPGTSSNPTDKEQEKSGMSAKNIILYGPPGTGKTYHTIDRALEIVDPIFYEQFSEDRDTLLKRYNELRSDGSIGFVTFHQSFSYEDFVEGLKAKVVDGQVTYEVEDGIFKRMCLLDQTNVEVRSEQDVDISGRTIWKMSLGNTQGDDAYIYDYCIENREIRLGYGNELDFSDCKNREDIIAVYQRNDIPLKEHDYAIVSVNTFRNEMKIGDLVVISDGNSKFRAIGEIAGDYQYAPTAEVGHYSQARAVTWHRVWEKSLPRERLLDKVFSQMTLYRLRSTTINLPKLEKLLNSSDGVTNRSGLVPGQRLGDSKYTIESVSDELVRVKAPTTQSVISFDRELINELRGYVQNGILTVDDIAKKKVFEKVDTQLEKYIVNGYPSPLAQIVGVLCGESAQSEEQPSITQRVLIIDEINRGNISSIFGELITLIEPSKRLGEREQLTATLPYSKEEFAVPANLHLVGTMNTADRSLALLDTALRRRFEFVEMMPATHLLDGLIVKGINIKAMLDRINQRIQALYDREHMIGHAFFMPLLELESEDPQFEALGAIFANKILPLLEEYFFEDWEKIRLVLGDNQKAPVHQFVSIGEEYEFDELFGTNTAESDLTDELTKLYRRSSDGLSPEAYRYIYES